MSVQNTQQEMSKSASNNNMDATKRWLGQQVRVERRELCSLLLGSLSHKRGCLYR